MTLGIWSGSFDCAPADQAELEQIVGDNIYRDGMRGLNNWLKETTMADTLAPRAIIGVMTPAMNTVVQPELEDLRPAGVTNQMQRFRLGGEAVSKDLIDEAEKLMDCHPAAIAIGLTTDVAPAKLMSRCAQLMLLPQRVALWSMPVRLICCLAGFYAPYRRCDPAQCRG